MRYRYVKKTSRVRRSPVGVKFLSLFLVLVGLVLIGSAVVPIFFYQFFVSPRFSRMVRPVTEETVLGSHTETDFTRVFNWFPTAPKLPPLPSRITHYTITIPKLRIEEAVVAIGKEDLSRNLVQYEGTALPGQLGNTVIFGHSVLPQFFNPKNYLTIFSTLPTLKPGDEIFVDFDGIRYKYVVEQMIEVNPDEISILGQRYDDAYITLITCVPPGTYHWRLAVRGRLRPS
jgi:sortase A